MSRPKIALADAFADVPDPRVDRTKKHRLSDIARPTSTEFWRASRLRLPVRRPCQSDDDRPGLWAGVGMDSPFMEFCAKAPGKRGYGVVWFESP